TLFRPSSTRGTWLPRSWSLPALLHVVVDELLGVLLQHVVQLGQQLLVVLVGQHVVDVVQRGVGLLGQLGVGHIDVSLLGVAFLGASLRLLLLCLLLCHGFLQVIQQGSPPRTICMPCALRPKPLDVANRLTQQFWVVQEHAKAVVAPVAQGVPDLASAVIVVNHEGPAIRSADAARRALGEVARLSLGQPMRQLPTRKFVRGRPLGPLTLGYPAHGPTTRLVPDVHRPAVSANSRAILFVDLGQDVDSLRHAPMVPKSPPVYAGGLRPQTCQLWSRL